MKPWDGALRLGFTNVPPEGRPLPLPDHSIPELSELRSHWVGVVPKAWCWEGAILELWVSHGGSVHCRTPHQERLCLAEGLDISRPLWAIVDVYGGTCAVQLLGEQDSLRHS